MPEIIRPTDESQFDIDGRMSVQAMDIPSFRKLVAMERGVLNNIMVTTRGGLGDNICTEPAIRYACKNFRSDIFVATQHPQLFWHLPLVKTFDVAKELPNWIDYLNYKTLADMDDLLCEFHMHMYSHVVDYHSMLMWRVQLPPKDKQPKIVCSKEHFATVDCLLRKDTDVLIHPGRTWPSRTLPKWWWDQITFNLLKTGLRPVIIGSEVENGCGFIEIETNGCLDLRGKLTVMESVALCQKANAIITNDSSPLHMAATGDAYIAFASTVKPPDLLMHWRHGEYGWRMKNFTNDWLCNHLDTTPTNTNMVDFTKADPGPWLKKPKEVTDWINEIWQVQN